MTDLHNKTILVTRPLPQAEKLCEMIQNSNGKCISFPTLAFEDVPFTDDIPKLGEQDWLVFISPQAVYSSVVAIRKIWPEFPPQVKFAAIGKGTAIALQLAGYNVAFHPQTNKGSEEFLEDVAFKNPRGQKIAVIRGEGGRELVDHELAARGAQVLSVIAYKRILPTVDASDIVTQLQQKKIDAIVGTSFEGIKNLKTLIGSSNWPYLQNVPLCVPGMRIKKLAQQHGYATIWVTSEMSDAAIMQTLAKIGTNKMTEDNDIKTTAPKSHKGIIIFILIGLAILLAGLGVAYFQLFRVNTSLAESVSNLQSNVAKSQDDLNAVQKNVSDLQSTEQSHDAIAQQQEKQLAEWRAAQNGDLNKWHRAEAEYLVKMANDNLQFSNNTALAISLLERADQELASIQDGSAASIRQAIQQNLTTIKALPQINTDDLYSQLINIDKQIDQLPLPANPLQPEITAPTATDPNQSWWQGAMDRIGTAMRKIVIVRKVGENAAPVVTPEEKGFLYQNLHAQLQNAIWGLLHRDNKVYQASIDRMQAWIKLYFVQDAELTTNTLQTLSELAKTDVQAQSINLDDTLTLFSNTQASAPAPHETTTPAQ